jgi:hypothetical protein
MAVHTGLGWRNPGERRFLNRSVAIAAVNAQTANMVLMAKGNRLRPHHFGVSDVRRPLQFEQCPQQGREQKYCPVNRGTGDCVRTAMKNLHRLSVQQGCRTPSPVQYRAVWSKQSQKAVMSHVKTCDYSSLRLIVIGQQFNSSKINRNYRTRKSLPKILTKSPALTLYFGSLIATRYLGRDRTDYRRFITNNFGSVISSIA